MNIEKPTQILVRRRAALGDTIMSTGVVRELKKKYVNSNIDVATEFLAVYNNNPHIRHLYHSDAMPDPSKYDIYINLDDAYEDNPVNHYVDSYFHRAFGETSFDKSVELFPTEIHTAHVDSFIAEHDLNKFIVIHMRQWYWAMKNMSTDTWFEVFEHLFIDRTDFKIVCVGSAADGFVDHPLFVDARGTFEPQELKALMDHAKCFVGTDSGPFQCAAASKTHIVALLTHLLPERIVPHRKHVMGYNSSTIMSDISCVGCNDNQQRPVRQISCVHGDFPCSNKFDSIRIANVILESL